MAEFIPLGLERVFEIRPKKFSDDRGFFVETYNFKTFQQGGISEAFVQDNHSMSVHKGTLRGLHFQLAPQAQAKLVRVVKGSIFDVAVDIRPNSKDFGKWVSLEVTAEKGNQIFIPAGFAHGFLTLQDNTEVAYKVDNYYSGEHDRSVRYDDPKFAIKWPDTGTQYQLSEKDRKASFLKDL